MRFHSICFTAAAAACLMVLSCATVQRKTDSYLFIDAASLDRPIDVWLRAVHIVSDRIPLSSEYRTMEDSLTAAASRFGFRLSTTHRGQRYIMDLDIRGRSFTEDLSTKNSVLAVLNLDTPAAGPAARVVYAAVSPNSTQSLYYLYRIGEGLFASLRSKIAAEAKRAREAAKSSVSTHPGS